jgi:hypothetical protein
LAQVSWWFHTQDVRDEFVRIMMNPNFEERQGDVAAFVGCISSELVAPTISVLKAIIEPEFFLRMTTEPPAA